jgi:hypothetical protein
MAQSTSLQACLVVAALLGTLPAASGQTVQCGQASNCATTQGRTGTPEPGGAVPTYPSSDPFRNPLMQPLPPAVSTTRPQRNTGQPIPTTPPR